MSDLLIFFKASSAYNNIGIAFPNYLWASSLIILIYLVC